MNTHLEIEDMRFKGGEINVKSINGPALFDC
jgi:hypothetical protein